MDCGEDINTNVAVQGETVSPSPVVGRTLIVYRVGSVIVQC